VSRVRKRAAYADVGEATRRAVELAMPDLNLPEARVLLALVSKLTTWSMMEDSLAVRQLGDATGMDERAVRRAVAGLVEKGAIVRVSAPGRRASTYSLPAPNPGVTNPGSDDPGSVEPGSVDAPNPGSTDHLPEDSPEITTPLPPQSGGDARHHGQHKNCRKCRTSPRAKAVVDEVAAQRSAQAASVAETRAAATPGPWRRPPPDALADARQRLAHPRAERPA
jgi:hypothetical protein